eukprot:Hpha_TRINITY_DN28590_c0_g1::TRINITY_DN28590_c0_g1_i1::g.18605::m.18605
MGGQRQKKKASAFSDPYFKEAPSLAISTLFDVTGKVALVTGGSKGIGKMIASALATNGAKVYICARDKELCEKTAAEIGAHAIAGDLSTEKGCIAVADELKAKENHLDLLFNNAGATWGAPLESYPDEAWQKVFDLNVRGVFNLTVKLLPLLKKAPPPARVVIISSVDGVRATQTDGPTAAFAYTVSKGAAVHLTKALCRALSGDRVTVNCIAPGVFPSNMTAFFMKHDKGREMAEGVNPLGRVGNTQDMAAIALYLSGSGSSWLNGAIIPLDGGAHLHDRGLATKKASL